MPFCKSLFSAATLLPCIAVTLLLTIVVQHNLVQPELEWKPFSRDEIYVANARGQIVLVHFSADWCTITAYHHVNLFGDKNVKVLHVLRSHNIALQSADYTNRNPIVKAELKRLESQSIPVIAIYAPGVEPVVLRDILTEDQLLAALQAAIENRERRLRLR